MNSLTWVRMSSIAIAGLAMASFGTLKAQGGSIVLGNSGWYASWNASQDGFLDLGVDAVTENAVFLEKSVNFLPSSINTAGGFINPAVINFQRTTPDASRYIILNDEILINHTGESWTGFRFILMNGNAQFDASGSNVGQVGGFSIEPFTTHEFQDNDTTLQVGGGILGSGPEGKNVWFPGSTSGGLVIDTNGSMQFVLKEQPVSAIPLPAAFWSGLSGLAALGLFGSVRRRHRKA